MRVFFVLSCLWCRKLLLGYFVLLSAHPINLGGLLIITSQESCKDQSGKLQRPAWKAVHIACDVGNRVHTRNDSDEDVRGYAYKQTIAWRALPWSFIIEAFFLR